MQCAIFLSVAGESAIEFSNPFIFEDHEYGKIAPLIQV